MIELDALTDLVDPVVIAAFEGWNDAADAASYAVQHLMETWGATVVGQVDPEDYYDFQVNRPVVSTDEHGERVLEWPGTVIAVASPPDLERDVILVRGIEPSFRWRRFASELLTACDELGAQLVITLGALLADTPHTRPVPVSGTASSRELAERTGLEVSTYEGPTGILGVIQDACARMDVPALSFWAAVPHYVPQPPCPKATLALVSRLEEVLGSTLPLGELVDTAKAWERGVEALAEEDEEVADYVRQLEEARDAADLPEASGEAIAREFERYLRRRGQE